VIDLATETLLTIERAAERLLVSQATLTRWITQGSNGVRIIGS
jgi:predicted site-specific integrase-resolvase